MKCMLMKMNKLVKSHNVLYEYFIIYYGNRV